MKGPVKSLAVRFSSSLRQFHHLSGMAALCIASAASVAVGSSLQGLVGHLGAANELRSSTKLCHSSGQCRAARLPSVKCVSFDYTKLSENNRRVKARAVTGMQMTIRCVPVQVANELIEAGHQFLDVRTPEEFAGGHVEGAVNIPYMYRHNGGMVKNDSFLRQVGDHFCKDEEVVVACQTGARSMMAAAELQAAQYDGITDVGGGFGAWMLSGLPYVKANGRATIQHVDM